MVEAAPRKRCTAAEALADPWVRRRGPAGSMSDSAAESPTAAVAHSSAQSPGPSASQRASQRGGTFNLAASANPRLIWAHKCLHDLAVQHGHAPTLFTRGDWLIAPPSSSADAAATPRESVLLVTRGELEVIEGPGGRLSGSLNDGAGSPGGGSQHRCASFSTKRPGTEALPLLCGLCGCCGSFSKQQMTDASSVAIPIPSQKTPHGQRHARRVLGAGPHYRPHQPPRPAAARPRRGAQAPVFLDPPGQAPLPSPRISSHLPCTC